MATSGRYLFNPDLAANVEEAFERAGIDPADATQRHINSARRSMNFMLSDWQTRGVREWAIGHVAVTTTPGMRSFELPVGAIDILIATLKRDGVDIPMQPLSRYDYQVIPEKDQRGMPDRYFVDRDLGTPTVYIWQTAENVRDVIDVWYFRRFEDVGGAHNTLDMPSYFHEAFVAGLAARLALKFAPDRANALEVRAEQALSRAIMEDGSRAPIDMRVGLR